MVGHYEVLGISPTASASEVRTAFKQRALMLHPDKGGSKEAFQQALLAFEILSDPFGRVQYDSQRLHACKIPPAEAFVHKGRSIPVQMSRCSKSSGDGSRQGLQAKLPGAASSAARAQNMQAAAGLRGAASAGMRTTCKRTGSRRFTCPRADGIGQAKINFAAVDSDCTTCSAATSTTFQHEGIGPLTPGISLFVASPSMRSFSSPSMSQTPGAGKTRRRIRDMHDIMEVMFALLQKLPIPKRRLVLEKKFVQQERLDLESWVIGAKRRRASVNSGTGACRLTDRLKDNMQDLVCFPHENFLKEKDLSLASDASREEMLKDTACMAICGAAELEDAPSASFEENASSFSIEEASEADCYSDIHAPEEEGEEEMMRGYPRLLGPDAAGCADCLMYMSTDSTDEDNQCSQFDVQTPDQRKPEGGSVRGVACKVRRSKAYYQANVCVDTLNLVAREMSELAGALDALVVLTSMKHRILNGMSRSSFEARVRAAVPEVLQEHGLAAEDLGLGFHVMISMRFWIRPPLHTPHQQSLESALSAWTRLNPFRTQVGESRRPTWASELDLQSRWRAFRDAYLSILEEHGKCREKIAARLDSLEDAAQYLRERRLERCNREKMAEHDRLCHRSRRAAAAARLPDLLAARVARAERRNQQAMAAEEHRQRRAEAAERRLEHLNRRAMAREDLCSRAWHRAEAVESRLMKRIEQLLRRWQRARRQQQRCLAARKARLAREAGRAARRKCKIERAAIAAARLAERQAQRSRDSWWRWSSRKDITIDELLSQR